MNIEKSFNQYYGQYFEQAVCAIINGEPPGNKTEYSFSFEEMDKMNLDAQKVAQYLDKKSAIYLGRKTSQESSDLVCDGEGIELKYVSKGAGTYFNTTISNIDLTGFESFHSRLVRRGYISKLKESFGDLVSETSLSPVNAKNRKIITEDKSKWEPLAKLEDSIRVEYVKDFFNYLVENEEILHQFISTLLTKECADKTVPDRVVIFDYKTGEITDISKEKILTRIESKGFRNAGKSFVFDRFRIAFGWQNGNGLSNPTIRVFLEK